MNEQSEHKSLRTAYNRAVILNGIRKNGPISRTRIQELTRIRTATITELVRELERERLVREAGAEGSGRGRKQVLLRLDTAYGFAVGVEFDAEHVIALAVDLEASPIATAREVLPPELDKQGVLDTIIRVAGTAIEKAGIDKGRILGIGIADPGLVDRRRGVSLLCSTIDGWRDVPLKEEVEGALDVSTCLEENTRAKTLAEMRFGAGKGIDSVMFIDFGPGIGCGIATADGLYRGATEAAGELGHTMVVMNGPVCRCGSYGCLESVASLPAIARRAAEAMKQGAGSLMADSAGGDLACLTAEHVFEAARAGDKLALGILDETARYLGIAIANAVNLFNPGVVVFDARLGEVEDLLLAPVRKLIKRQALAVATRGLEFRVAELGAEAGALGAATLVLDKVFEIPQLPIPEFV